MAELAVEGCTVSLVIQGQSAASINIATSPSSDILVNLIDDKGVYFGDIDVDLTGITFVSGETFVCESGTITIKGTCSDVLEGTKKAVQKGDSGTDTFTFTGGSTGAIVDVPVTIQITDAGQTDVLT